MTKRDRSDSGAKGDGEMEMETTNIPTNEPSGALSLEALAELDRVRTASFLSAGLAHEISNPLMSLLHSLAEAERICGALERAPDGSDGAYIVALTGHVGDANVCGKAIGGVIRDFKLFLHTERTILPTLVDPRPLVERAVRIAQPQIRAVARLSVSAAETPLVRATSSSITQITLNLLLNAAEALAESSGQDNLVEVRLGVEHGQVVIEVTDNGRGLDAESLERVFCPYVTTKPVEGALGFGLPLCRALARRFGGELSARSVLGWLTCFRLSLPIAES
jgi:signal transduction histidine kinase